MILAKETAIILDLGSAFKTITSKFELANGLNIYSFACCIGVQPPSQGDKYIGLGAVIFPCNSNASLHDQLKYGRRINKYYTKENEAYQLWEYNNEDLDFRWGNTITKDEKVYNIIRQKLQSEFVYKYVNCMFRYNYFTLTHDIKSECVRLASKYADIFNMSIASMVEERMNNIKEGNI